MDILVTYFDPFDGKDINNSEIMAKKLHAELNHPGIKLHLCKLRTVYDKAFSEVEDCIKSLESPPRFVVSLGEAGCVGVKIETRAINYDKSSGPDNEGIERYGSAIYPGESKTLGVTLPVQKAYCELTDDQKRGVFISKDAGSFVCNNTLYHSLRNLDIPVTFIHVPTRKCTRGSEHEAQMSGILQSMLKTFSKNLDTPSVQPANKNMVKEILKGELATCERQFYSILRKEY